MKLSSTCLVLLSVGVCRVAATDISTPVSAIAATAKTKTIEVLHPAIDNTKSKDDVLTPQNNYGGWVNPEDLPPMPQCIAQQDPSAWLNAMTKCTSKICIRHFGVICTRHQWLTYLGCLSIEISPEVVQGYLPHCGRSVLAKAQLYNWIRDAAGRTWLVDIGDANGLNDLSPASLAAGYAPVDIIYKAPTCLANSLSVPSRESFQHIIGSCSFTSSVQHTGNAARPWEYNENLHSMTALDSETVGYDLTGYSIWDGDYFDKECFCSTFTIDANEEPCPDPNNLDLTKERLWMDATCGPESLFANWTDAIKTTDFAYIPVNDWRWPKCVNDIPKPLINLPYQCATNACARDSRGYCKVTRAVDRSCFCHKINYDSCGGSCHVFESRIDYVKWLHNLCGDVEDWHGLPSHWRQLAAPTISDIIPWQWTLTPSHRHKSKKASSVRSGHVKATNCASTDWKFQSLILVNAATFLAVFFPRRIGLHRLARYLPWQSIRRCWFSTGILIAALQLVANWFNAFLVSQTPGYEDIAVTQLILFWCTMPRLTWLLILLVVVQPSNYSLAASVLFAEAILQGFAAYYMIMTVSYGINHDFYLGGMELLERSSSAEMMYAGALMWLIVACSQLLVIIWGANTPARTHDFYTPKWQARMQPVSNFAEDLMALLETHWALLEERLFSDPINGRSGLGETSPLRSPGNDTNYGTLPTQDRINTTRSRRAFVTLYAVTVVAMLLLWIAQWLFWAGFIGLSLQEYCPPSLGFMTAGWAAFSVASVSVGAV